jgi:ABC-type glycerol-3-phosphate transport system permease component
MLMTSLAYAGGSALFQTACTVVAAYCTAKYRGAISDFTFNLVLVTIALPIVGGLASMLQVVEELNLYNTMVGMWIMKFGFNSMYYFIFYAAFKSLSWEYAESAFVDGASHFTVFFRIMLPLVMGLTGTVFLLLFIGYWNDFETPYVFMEVPTLAIGLYAVLNGWSVDYKGDAADLTVPQQIVAGLIVFLPIFVVFLVFRNKIMGNLTEGGIKA